MKTKITTIVVIMLFITGLTFADVAIKSSPPQDDGYLTMAAEMPAPVGGLPAIYKHITEYPKVAKAAGLQGKVYVLAFINEKGDVDDAKLVKGIGGGCDEAAVNAVKKTKFNPGKQEGKNVKVKMPLAITFKIE